MSIVVIEYQWVDKDANLLGLEIMTVERGWVGGCAGGTFLEALGHFIIFFIVLVITSLNFVLLS